MKTNHFNYTAAQDLTTYNTGYLSPDVVAVFQRYSAVNANTVYSFPEGQQALADCSAFLLNIFNAKQENDYDCLSTSGSSEALFLAAAQLKQQAQHDDVNIVCFENIHSAWQGVSKLLNIKLVVLPNDCNQSHFLASLNARTVAVITTLGCPTNLLFDKVAQVNNWLVEYHNNKDHFIPIHVDAAIGGFVVPFYYPEITWDFKLLHVKSINVSSHKYGFVYPALGWLIREKQQSTASALHENDYLGADIKTHTVRFSHSAGPLMTQQYQIQKLGTAGYRAILSAFYTLKDQLSQQLDALPEIILINKNHASLPGVTFKLKEHSLRTLATHLKNFAWYLPVYQHPDHGELARIVIKNGITRSDLQSLIAHIQDFIHQPSICLDSAS